MHPIVGAKTMRSERGGGITVINTTSLEARAEAHCFTAHFDSSCSDNQIIKEVCGFGCGGACVSWGGALDALSVELIELDTGHNVKHPTAQIFDSFDCTGTSVSVGIPPGVLSAYQCRDTAT